MATKVSSIIGVKVDSVDDSPQFSLGTIVAGDADVYQYVVAAAAISAADSEASRFCVAIDENFAASLVTTANAKTWRRVGFAPAFTIASGKYFWARVGGTPRVRVVASASADVSLRTTTTAGRLGTASTVSAVIFPGMVLVVAASASGASAGSTTRQAIVTLNVPTRQTATGGVGTI